jgi:hypothetical protein
MISHTLIESDNLASILYEQHLSSENIIVKLDDDTRGDHLTIFLGSRLLHDCHIFEKIIKKSKSYRNVTFAPFSFKKSSTLNSQFKLLKKQGLTINVRDSLSFANAKHLGIRKINNTHDVLLSSKEIINATKGLDKECAIFTSSKSDASYCLEGIDIIDICELDSFDKVVSTLSTFKTLHTNHIELAMFAISFGNDVKLYKDRFGFNFEIYKQSLYRLKNVKWIEEAHRVSKTGQEVSIVCACMNRYDILNLNIRSWLKYNEVAEIIIVDWSSAESLEHLKEIDDRIKVIRVQDETYFNIAKAYNLAIDYASYPFILKMDVDYMLNPYYNFFIEHPKPDNEDFYAGDWRKNPNDNTLKYLAGLCYAMKKDIIDVGGYNETFEGYGYDDTDLIDRLSEHGLTKHGLTYNHCVLHIPHPDVERSKNYQTKSIAESGSSNREKRNTCFTRRKYFVLEEGLRYTLVAYERTNLNL